MRTHFWHKSYPLTFGGPPSRRQINKPNIVGCWWSLLCSEEQGRCAGLRTKPPLKGEVSPGLPWTQSTLELWEGCSCWEWSSWKNLGTVSVQYFHDTVFSAKRLREVSVLESEPERVRWGQKCHHQRVGLLSPALRATESKELLCCRELCSCVWPASQFLSLRQDTRDEKPDGGERFFSDSFVQISVHDQLTLSLWAWQEAGNCGSRGVWQRRHLATWQPRSKQAGKRLGKTSFNSAVLVTFPLPLGTPLKAHPAVTPSLCTLSYSWSGHLLGSHLLILLC